MQQIYIQIYYATKIFFFSIKCLDGFIECVQHIPCAMSTNILTIICISCFANFLTHSFLALCFSLRTECPSVYSRANRQHIIAAVYPRFLVDTSLGPSTHDKGNSYFEFLHYYSGLPKRDRSVTLPFCQQGIQYKMSILKIVRYYN